MGEREVMENGRRRLRKMGGGRLRTMVGGGEKMAAALLLFGLAVVAGKPISMMV